MFGLASWIALLYSASLGVPVENSSWTSWRRMAPALVVVVLLAAGMVRANIGRVSIDDWSTFAGMVVGAAVALGVFVAGMRFARRRPNADDDE
jgi:hypothetical protein